MKIKCSEQSLAHGKHSVNAAYYYQYVSSTRLETCHLYLTLSQDLKTLPSTKSEINKDLVGGGGDGWMDG